MKEPYCHKVTMLMYSGLTVPDGHKLEIIMVNGEVVEFKYPHIVADHYRYRGVVDNNNSLRHDGGVSLKLFRIVHGEQSCGTSECFISSYNVLK